MSWFKSTNDGDSVMSNAIFDTKTARATGTDSRSTDFDRSPSTSSTGSRPELRVSADAKGTAAPKPGTSVLGPTLHFKGELRAEEDFVLQGRVEGSIHHTQNLTIGSEGFVKGDSRAQTILVEGTVEGDLYALESITVRPTARIQGNLLAPRVSIADGASFNGKVDMASAARAVRHITERASTTLEEPAVAQLLVASGENG